MSEVVSRCRVANGKRDHVSGAVAVPARRVAGLSPRAFFLPITHLRHFLMVHVNASHISVHDEQRPRTPRTGRKGS